MKDVIKAKKHSNAHEKKNYIQSKTRRQQRKENMKAARKE